MVLGLRSKNLKSNTFMTSKKFPISKDKERQCEYFCTLRDLCINDKDWYKLFDEASRGIFKKKVKVDGDNLVTKHKGKIIEIYLGEDPEIVLEKCKILYRKMGFRTTTEIETEKNMFLVKNSKGWSSIRREADRKYHLHKYIDTIAIIKHLNEEETKDLRHNLFLGVLSGVIDDKNIIFENNRIMKVKM